MRLQRLMVPFGPPSASRSLPGRSCHVTQSFILEMMVRTTKKFVGLPIIFCAPLPLCTPVVSPAAIWISLPRNVGAGKNAHAADTPLKD